MPGVRSSHRPLLLYGGAISLALLLIAGLAVAMAQMPGVRIIPSPNSRPVATLSPTQDILERERALQQPGASVAVSGPSTMGSQITLRGRQVQLPADAYVYAYVVTVTCESGKPCPPTPLYVVERGQSRLSVAQPTGQIVQEQVAPTDSNPFDSIKRQLP